VVKRSDSRVDWWDTSFALHGSRPIDYHALALDPLPECDNGVNTTPPEDTGQRLQGAA